MVERVIVLLLRTLALLLRGGPLPSASPPALVSFLNVNVSFGISILLRLAFSSM